MSANYCNTMMLHAGASQEFNTYQSSCSSFKTIKFMQSWS